MGEGFNDLSKVADVIVNGHFCWPSVWLERYTGLQSDPLFYSNNGVCDKVVCRDKNGIDKLFSCNQVWKDINNFGDMVSWYSMV